MSKSVAIVTGASQGIGRATALRFSRDHSAMVLVARNRANLEQTAEAVRKGGAAALVIDADMAQPEPAQAVVGQALAAFDRIDALLNIAGAVPQIDLFETTDARWQSGLALRRSEIDLTVPPLSSGRKQHASNRTFRRRDPRQRPGLERVPIDWNRPSPLAAPCGYYTT